MYTTPVMSRALMLGCLLIMLSTCEPPTTAYQPPLLLLGHGTMCVPN